ncbi:hypothetical protein T12_14475 [Trichinella patagoniensis]|uniref:Uncharacterized protein n=1 Tax=Trichinella patagoniensis TaxID=990121 RepID=A0A0V0YYC1_9BILA|nr:hypothetical protein T12_14475 [Trichinella patagoniensis]
MIKQFSSDPHLHTVAIETGALKPHAQQTAYLANA